ncbi:MAG: AAA family ATPase [Spirochaetaceae bacterium]
MITRIELDNFMSHEHTVIEPSDGLTVLVGPNNCGKSAVVAALQILAHNETSTYVMRHGEKETRVAVHTDDGHEIEWRRKKSGGPSYTVDGRLFDRLGRGTVPQEVSGALRLAKVTAGSETNRVEFDLHFGEQKAPVFLIDRSAAQAAQFFASSSDAEKLVRMQARHKDKVRDAKRDRSRLAGEHAELEDALAMLAPLEEIETRVAEAERRHADIAAQETAINAGAELVERLSRTAARAELTAAETGVLARLREPPVLSDTDGLARLIRDLAAAARERDRAEEVGGTIGALAAPPKLSDPRELERRIAGLERRRAALDLAARRAAAIEAPGPPPREADTDGLTALISKLEAEAAQAARARAAAEAAAAALEDAREALRSFAVEQRTCPTCGAELDPDGLVRAAERGIGGHAHGT